MKKFKRYISQQCMGYNADFSQSHFENVVEFQDGSLKTMYSTHTTLHNGMGVVSNLNDHRPYVAVPKTTSTGE